MAELPTGTVTFLFTDIEGSTRLWEQYPEVMRQALARHDTLLTACIAQHGGTVIKSRGEGDSLFAVFARAIDAMTAALAAQQALLFEAWPAETPLRVRIVLHTGEAELRDGDYLGTAVNRCARLRAIAHGGQVLLSRTTADLVSDFLPSEASLLNLGEQRLRDLTRPEQIFQLLHPDLPSHFPLPDAVRSPLKPRPSEVTREGRGQAAANRGVKVKRSVMTMAAVILTLLLGSLWLLRGLSGRRAVPSGASAPIRSLAVLPLKNLSGDPTQDYFADGVTDSLTTDLAHIHSLRVISFQSVQQYKDERRKSLPEIAREMNVDAVVEGSVQKSGRTVLINAQLIRAATDQHLWAERYTRNASDLLRAQSQIVIAIATAIKVQLTPHERTRLASTRPVNPDAQSHYFLGRFQYGLGTEAGFRRAIREYEQATQQDSGFAPAYAGIADAYSSLSSLYVPPRIAMPEAEAAARKALSLDPDLAEAHSALGYIQVFYHWNRRQGERELLKAIALKPNYSTAHLNYGVMLLSQGRYGEGLQQFRQAQALEPTSAIISLQIEWALFLRGQYDQTIAQAKHTLEIEPKMALSHSQMGLAYLYQGKKAMALTELKQAVDLEPSSGTATFYSYGLAASGKTEEARRVLNRFLGQSRGKYICAYEIACAYEGMNDRLKALRWLKRGHDEKCDCLVWGAVEPWLKELRKDPRYQAILAQTGLVRY